MWVVGCGHSLGNGVVLRMWTAGLPAAEVEECGSEDGDCGGADGYAGYGT